MFHNHRLNVRCQCCTQHDHKIFKIWTLQAVYDKACVNDAILHVTAASQQRVLLYL